MSNLDVYAEYLVREIPPVETGCSSSFEDEFALGFGMGELFESSLIFLEWTRLTAGLGERENEIELIYLLIHRQEGKCVSW